VLRFGDGYTGRIPVPEIRPDGLASGLRLRYQLGGGAAANRGSHLPWETVGAPVRSARNVAPLAGGAEPETISAARARAGKELTRRYRAVTAPDYEQIATEKGRLGMAVARVHVGVGRHPRFPCDVVPGAYTVVIVPDVRRDATTGMPVVAAPRPDPGMLIAVRRRLDAARLAGSEVHVEGPSYRPTTLAVTVGGGVADAASLHATLVDALTRYLDPLVGGEGDGWPFGGPLRPSELLGLAQEAAGNTATVVAVSIGVDGVAPDEDCHDLELRPHELPNLTHVEFRISAEPQSEGVLR
jgi:predicted phage baseplate assembly protein